jgi:hypothetical protein
MAFFTENEMRSRAIKRRNTIKRNQINFESASSDKKFDVFLSHSSFESDDILDGVIDALEDFGLSVYVDKYVDDHLSPDTVTKETAEILRNRMNSSRILIYIYSKHSKLSRWMPWELGYFDGLQRRVFIFPVTADENDSYKKEEYLSLYPDVEKSDLRNLKGYAKMSNLNG